MHLPPPAASGVRLSPIGFGPRAFALVAVLAILALTLILVLSISVLLQVETRSSAAGKNQLLARQNALFGLDTAIAQLQQFAGRDQSVTFPATTYYPAKNVTNASGPLFDDPTFGYRSIAATAPKKTYLTPSERTVWNGGLQTWWNAGRNPRWIGIADSSLRRDSGVSSQQFGEPRRDQLPVWLVSGNEKLHFDPATATAYPSGYLTPDSVLPDPAADPSVIYLVGEGSATIAADSTDALDGRVKVKRQEILGIDQAVGHYAYWVGDESTKANFAVRDPWFEETDIQSANYRNRLQVPQRIGWENISTGSGSTLGAGAAFSANDEKLENINAAQEVALLELAASGDIGKTADLKKSIRKNFHSLTAHSRGLFTDTALGGLRKDLTAGADMTMSDPIPDRSRYFADDPRFGGSNNGGFPRIAATAGLPVWDTVRKWYESDPGDRAPILANFQLFTTFTHRSGEVQMHFLPIIALWNPYDVALPAADYSVKVRHNVGFWHFGMATLNSAYVDPTPGTAATDFSDGHKQDDYYISQLSPVGWYASGAKFGVNFNPANLAGTFSGSFTPDFRFSPFDTGATLSLPTSPNATWVNYHLNSEFAPGEVKVFTVGTSQQVDPAALHAQTASVDLQNTYDAAFPESFWFTVASGLQKEPGVVPTATDTVRCYADTLAGNTPTSISISLSKGGQEIWKYFAGAGMESRIFTSLFSGLAATDPKASLSALPATWKRIYHFDEWPAVSKTVSDTRERESPIRFLSNFGLNPFLVTQSQIYNIAQGRFMQDSLGSKYRAFAHSNLLAKTMDPIDILDLARSKDPNNNLQGGAPTFNTLRRLEPRSNYKWWDSQVDGDNGFTVFGWKDRDASLVTKGLSFAPMRQDRADANLLSLGQLQQVNLAEYTWQPGYPIGNSEASPYVDRNLAAGLLSYQLPSANSSLNMLLDLGVRPANDLRNFPNDDRNRFLDLSFVLNENLWDTYFFSSVPQTGPLSTDNIQPLPNSRVRFRSDVVPSPVDVREMGRAAEFLENIGALNINSTNAESWKALLTAFRNLAIRGNGLQNPAGTVPISRNMLPQEGPIDFTDSTRTPAHYGANSSGDRDYRRLFFGFRYLTDPQIQSLASRIVDEIRLRGPFYSLGDFVNRRLVSPDRSGSDEWLKARTSNLAPSSGSPPSVSYPYTHSIGSGYDPIAGMAGLNGAVQRALNLSGINGGANYPFSDDPSDRVFRVNKDISTWATLTHPMSIFPDAAYYLDTEHLAGVPVGEVGQLLSHAPGFVTQADVLAMIGPALTARGDTFLIRTYGDSVDRSGRILSKCWLEAVVQRVPEYVDAGNSAVDPPSVLNATNARFGRKFKVVKLRWLSPEEI